LTIFTTFGFSLITGITKITIEKLINTLIYFFINLPFIVLLTIETKVERERELLNLN